MSQGGQSGLATEVARQLSGRTRELAGHLERHEPSDLLEQVRAYARRRPVVFLAGAALAGVVAGRLTKSLAAGAPDSGARALGSDYGNGYRPGEPLAVGAAPYASPDYPGAGYQPGTGYQPDYQAAGNYPAPGTDAGYGTAPGAGTGAAYGSAPAEGYGSGGFRDPDAGYGTGTGTGEGTAYGTGDTAPGTGTGAAYGAGSDAAPATTARRRPRATAAAASATPTPARSRATTRPTPAGRRPAAARATRRRPSSRTTRTSRPGGGTRDRRQLRRLVHRRCPGRGGPVGRRATQRGDR